MKEDRFLIKPEAVEDMRTVYEILTYSRQHYPEQTAYRQIEGKDEESTITFSAFGNHVDSLREALFQRGMEGKHIAVLGETSIEWITAYLAIVSGLGVCVPIDRELTPETMAQQLSWADADIIFCSAKSMKKLQKVLPLCDSILEVFLMRSESVPEGLPVPVTPMCTLLEEGAARISAGDCPPARVIDPDATALIIYTSGTTGANKGVMLSNRNIMGTLRGCARLLMFPRSSISVLPVNHSYELHAHLMSCLYCGTTVGINDDLKHLLKNLEHFAPEMSCMVPMMLDLIVRRLKKEIADSGKQTRFDRAVSISNALRKVRIDLRRQLFSDVLKPLGGKLKMIICGGAALSQETIDFLDSIGIQIYNGYGITECSPVAAVNPNHKQRKFSVGHILPTTRVRIADPDSEGNGEIQFQGDNVMQGYYKAPEDTSKVFTRDGWFRTGDIGHLDRDGFVYISGRLKNLIILPNGKNVFPEEVEEALMKHIPYIKECVVLADEGNTGIYAIAFLDRDFCREHNLTTPEEKRAFMEQDIRDFNRVVPSFKRINDIEITEKEFEKNTTQKIQRFKIQSLRKNKEKEEHV